jgi:hypothetical protein
MYRYYTSRIPTIPLDKLHTNGCRFSSFNEAMLYVSQHCIFHYGCFTKAMAQAYIVQCHVFDPIHYDYVSLENISPKVVAAHFGMMTVPDATSLRERVLKESK